MATEKRDRQRANRQLKQIQQAKQDQRQKATRRALWGVGGVVALLAVVLGLAAVGGAFSDDDGDSIESTLPADLATTTTVAGEPVIVPFTYGTGECPPADVTEPVKTFEDAPQECIDPAQSYTATFSTSQGDIVVELDGATVPGTVNNFVTLARYGYYDDTRIFRADPSIDIIQGGGASNTDDPGYSIPDEGTGFTYEPGDLVMARTGAPNSAGGQWFFVGGPNAANLNAQGTYVTFGTVTEGLDIVQAIIAGAGGADGQTPAEEIVVDTVTIEEGALDTPTTEPAATADTTAETAAPTTSG